MLSFFPHALPTHPPDRLASFFPSNIHAKKKPHYGFLSDIWFVVRGFKKLDGIVLFVLCATRRYLGTVVLVIMLFWVPPLCAREGSGGEGLHVLSFPHIAGGQGGLVGRSAGWLVDSKKSAGWFFCCWPHCPFCFFFFFFFFFSLFFFAFAYCQSLAWFGW